MQQAGSYFKPIAPIPDTSPVTSEAFANALRRLIDQMQRDAERAGVTLPPRYTFSFAVQTTLVKFDTSSLGLVAEQLGQVKVLADILYAAHINALDGIQRVRVSADDATAQGDYFEGHSETNNLAVLTPYVITFRSFTTEVSEVLSRLASSPHGFIVRSINVQPAGAVTGMRTEAAAATMMPVPSPATFETMEPLLGQYVPGAPPGPRGGIQPAAPPPPVLPPVAPPPPPSRGGLPTVLNEQLLRVTLVVDVVKLLPKK